MTKNGPQFFKEKQDDVMSLPHRVTPTLVTPLAIIPKVHYLG